MVMEAVVRAAVPGLVLLAVLLLVLRTILVLRSIHQSSSSTTTRTTQRRPRLDAIQTVVVLGSGGHTTEMLHLIKNLDPTRYTPLIYIVATTDTTSIKRVDAFQEGRMSPNRILKIPRSREVGQSYLSSIATTLWSLVVAFGVVFQLRPGLVLCNGPGTCLPIAIVTLMFRILGLCEGKIIFVESFCRVTRYVIIFLILFSTHRVAATLLTLFMVCLFYAFVWKVSR
jgi:beta-1,4-N-acetylglucosaminyltransferase